MTPEQIRAEADAAAREFAELIASQDQQTTGIPRPAKIEVTETSIDVEPFGLSFEEAPIAQVEAGEDGGGGGGPPNCSFSVAFLCGAVKITKEKCGFFFCGGIPVTCREYQDCANYTGQGPPGPAIDSDRRFLSQIDTSCCSWGPPDPEPNPCIQIPAQLSPVDIVRHTMNPTNCVETTEILDQHAYDHMWIGAVLRLEEEYTDDMLIDNIIAALPDFPSLPCGGDLLPGQKCECFATYDISPSETNPNRIFGTIERFQYKLSFQSPSFPCTLRWREIEYDGDDVFVASVARSMQVSPGMTETPVFQVDEPSTNHHYIVLSQP